MSGFICWQGYPHNLRIPGSIDGPPRHRGNLGRPAALMHQTSIKPYQRTLFLHAFFIWKTCDLNVNKNPTLQRALLFPRFYHANRFFFEKSTSLSTDETGHPFFPSAHIIHTPTIIIIHMWLCKHVCVCVCPISMTLIPDRTETLPTGRSRRACSKNDINTSLRGRERA